MDAVVGGATEEENAMKVQGGLTNYGQAIGILMLDTVFPRIPGDIGNATTFPFPVRYRVVKGASLSRVVKQCDPTLIQPFIEGAQELERDGVKAITTSCGFLAAFQPQIADSVKVPVFTSSLIQVHMARALIRRDQKVGVITARAQSLTAQHLRGVGIQDIPVVVVGMDESPEFSGTFIEGKANLDVERAAAEMTSVATRLIQLYPEVGAIVLECTNMPPFAKHVQNATGLPVFDIVTLVNYAYSATQRQRFRGAM
jgi:Asp/Glu/hydantoin racemase